MQFQFQFPAGIGSPDSFFAHIAPRGNDCVPVDVIPCRVIGGEAGADYVALIINHNPLRTIVSRHGPIHGFGIHWAESSLLLRRENFAPIL
jgi:hypothetical protein